jgi:hypothetical protein
MATAKDKQSALKQWACAFPDHQAWKDKFLLKLTGPVISGLCLDETRDPKIYTPKFFFHNLLIETPGLTIGYSVSLRHRGVSKSLKYAASIADSPELLKAQIESARLPISFEIFVRHIQGTIRGDFGPIGIYLPHAYCDIMSVGSFLGDDGYFRSTLDDVCERIAAIPHLNLHIIGSVAKWRKEVELLLDSCGKDLIERHLTKLRLPPLANEPMPYIRPAGFPCEF